MTAHCWEFDERQSTWQHKPPRAEYRWTCLACEAVGTATFRERRPDPRHVGPARVYVENGGVLRLVPSEYADECDLSVIYAVHDL